MKKQYFPATSAKINTKLPNSSTFIRNPKHTTILTCKDDEKNTYGPKVHKLVSRIKVIRKLDLSQVYPLHIKYFLRFILTNKSQFFRSISLPSTMTLEQKRILKQAKNLAEYGFSKEYHPYRKIHHRKFETLNFYLKKEKLIDDFYQNHTKKLPRFNRMKNIVMDLIWSKEGLGKVRKAMSIFSDYPNLQATYLKIEEYDISLFLHSYHTLQFWKKLKSLNILYETADSLNGLIEYGGQLSNLEYLVIYPGKKFHENAIKKGDYNLSAMGKFQSFPKLKLLDIVFNLKELPKQAIAFLKSMTYPQSLQALRLEMIIPDMDVLIQKSHTSLTTITYLSVENQTPFKEFIANHAPLVNLKSFNLVLRTKQMQLSQSKLVPALVKHMKVLEDFEMSLDIENSKPFRYLALYNNMVVADRVKSMKIFLKNSALDFLGADLLELDNRMISLKEVSLSFPHEKVDNQLMEPFFKALCIKPLETLKLHFLQPIDEKKLDKRFETLKKCKNLTRLLLRFSLPELSDLYPVEMFQYFDNHNILREATLELISSGSDNFDFKSIAKVMTNMKNLEYGYLKSNTIGMLKTKNSKVFKEFNDKEYIFIDEVKKF